MKALLLLTVFLSAFCFACASQARARALESVEAQIAAAKADGFVTNDEVAQIDARVDEMRDTPEVDWMETVGTIVASIGATLGAARILPNRAILGGPEAKALDMAAYGSPPKA